ncbi:hypothetical protein DPEC_G00230840 [Dallia pectoralis]|uniref:Uncharacterized protein n=1 Tax=Dallia pectoralis TaxID=75939 RepID=A0ACC2G1J0_DALPE|nr:hypothetical protein DPEC_G00230840 [Dallia pectoralis]
MNRTTTTSFNWKPTVELAESLVTRDTGKHIFPINHHIIAIGLHTSSAHWHFQLCHHCHITKIIQPSVILAGPFISELIMEGRMSVFGKT